MKKITVMLALVVLAGCSRPASYMMRHHVSIPSTNHYTVIAQTRILTDLDSRRAPSAPLPPAALLEYSTDGKTFTPFPMVSYSTASNTQGIREITVSSTDVWIRITTTNQSDVGRSVLLTFMEKLR